MTAPRIEVDLAKIRNNARHLVNGLAPHGVAVTGVTKGVCGHPDIAQAMLHGGVRCLGDARVVNVERMRSTGIEAPIVLIRTPMRSQTDRIVRACGTSLNTDFDVVEALARSALRAGLVHQVVLMVEMGDGREGVRPVDMAGLARRITELRGVTLTGIGANFACLSGCAPAPSAMDELSALAAAVERACGIRLKTVSGGSSASLAGIMTSGLQTRVNDLRLGEAILLGRDPVTGCPIDGLFSDAFVLVGEVIESAAFAAPSCLGQQPAAVRMSMTDGDADGGKALLALGDQDTDTAGLSMPAGLKRLGSTSDHLVLRTSGAPLAVGTEVLFQPDYSALMRAMNAPGVAKIIRNCHSADRPAPGRDRQLAPERA